jgi:catechol 2,3-dioxygenase-like lactoylglutathione lyase family enzyme
VFRWENIIVGFPSAAKAMTFIITRDRPKSVAFYRDVLGFPLISDDLFAAVFDLNGTMLRISQVDTHQATPSTVLGWEVPDIVAAAKAIAAKGAKFNIYEGFGQDELGIWTSPASDAKVAWFCDPDGNVLSLTEFRSA